MLLSDTKVRSTKPSTKTITLNDGGGLQLEVSVNRGVKLGSFS